MIGGLYLLLFLKIFQGDFSAHIASVGRRRREKIILSVLDFISQNGYGLCVESDIRIKVRALVVSRRSKKSSVWKHVITRELLRIANHLRDKNFWPITRVFADVEFNRFRDIIEKIFKTKNVVIGKNHMVVPSDILAYVNLRNKKLLKKYRNISEL